MFINYYYYVQRGLSRREAVGFVPLVLP